MSKKPEITEFDQFIQGSLEGAKVPAPNGVWEGISAATTGASTASQAGLIAKLGGIKSVIIGTSVVVVATLTTLVLTQNNNSSSSNENTVLVESNENNTSSSNDNEDNSGPAEDKDGSGNNENRTDTEVINSSEPGHDENASGTHSGTSEENGNTIGADQNTIDQNREGDDKQNESVQAPLDFTLGAKEICPNGTCVVSIKENKAEVDHYWMVDGVKHFNKSTLTINPENSGQLRISLISFPNGKKATVTKTLWVHNSKPKVTSAKIQRGLYSFKTDKAYKSYQWNFEGTPKVSVEASPRHYFDYQKITRTKVILWTVDEHGCKDSVHTRVSLVEAPLIPNAFSPYVRDGVNDQFIIPIEHETYYKLLVYNAVGELVFESSSKNNNWDGRDMRSGDMMPAGAYTYKFVYQQVGTGKTTKQGTIFLMK